MSRKWHHVRILQSTYELLHTQKGETETDAEVIDRIVKSWIDIPNRYIGL